MGDSNSTILNTEFGDITVSRIPLRGYAELLRVLDSLPKSISNLIKGEGDSVDKEAILQNLPKLIADSLPEMAKVLSVSTDKDADFIMNLDLATAIELVDKILEVNDFERIAAAIKKMLARRTQETSLNQGQVQN